MAASKHDDSLEQFFREKTNEFDIPFNEADWESMQQRLDEAENAALLNTQNIWWRYAVAAVLLITFSGLGFIIYQNYNRIDELKSQLSQQQIQPSENPFANNKNPIAGNTKTNDGTDTQRGDANNPLAINNGNKNGNSNNHASAANGNQVNEKSSLDDPQNKVLRGATPFLASEKKMIYPYEITAIETSTLSVPPPQVRTNSTGNNRPVIAAAIGNGYDASASTEIDNKPYAGTSGFSFGITAGPDFSTAGALHNFYAPGYKIGAMAEYSLNKNFSISTGFIYSNVNYTASGSEYNLPNGSWKYGIVPQQAEAACAILSIPVRIKFNFAHFNSSRFYITTGVSSYIMLNEAYHFDYQQQNTSHLLKGWSGHTGTRHWLSNAIFSIGYEFDLNETMSLRIEPYLNIPMRGVGRFNVDLYSTGTLISINYHFN